MRIGPKRIAVFKPYNARVTSAFYGAQHTLFKHMQERFGYTFTYLVDDPSVTFDGVRTAYIARSTLGSYLTGACKLLFSDNVPYPFYRDVDFSDFDVVISEGIYYSLLHYVRHCATKVILNDSLSWDPRFRSRRVMYLNRYFGRSRSVVVTEKVRSIYASYGVEIPTWVIGHPIDTRSVGFRERVGPAERLVSVGRLVREKGFGVIVTAVSDVASRYPGITLDIFGTGPLEGELRALVREHGMESRIHLKGHLQREKLLEALAGYDLFISHPIATPRFAEPFLMANMEAMSSGLPVITSGCGGVPAVVRDNAVIVAQGDVKSLSDTIERFVCGAEDVRARSVRGRTFVEENYALNSIAEKWHEVIEEVLVYAGR